MAGGSTKKSKKHGRNSAWCRAYFLSETRAKNKVRKLIKHLKIQMKKHNKHLIAIGKPTIKHHTDGVTVHCLNQLPERFKPPEWRGLKVGP